MGASSTLKQRLKPPAVAATNAALTDSSGGTASSTLASTIGISQIVFPVGSLAVASGAGFGATTAGDVVTAYVPGYKFKLIALDFVTGSLVGAGSSASAPCNLEIGSTNVTGGVCTVTLANTNTIGELTSGTSITAANTGSASDDFSIEKATSVVFTAGEGSFVVTIQNMDTADAIASIAAKSVLGIADDANLRSKLDDS